MNTPDLKRQFFHDNYVDLQRWMKEDVIDKHPLLRHLPEVDRVNAAHCAATHALLVIRAQSIAEMEDR